MVGWLVGYGMGWVVRGGGGLLMGCVNRYFYGLVKLSFVLFCVQAVWFGVGPMSAAVQATL